jgi:alkylation response protein AidB-like acyl-CoA dehydrogenase
MLEKLRDELTGLAAAHRDEGDSLRRLPPALSEAFLGHDIYRMLLPADLGGGELDPLDYLQLVEEIASIDGSIGWNLAIGSGSDLYVGYLPPERALAMFADSDCGIAGAYAPIGQGEAVDGGYRVSGHWGWASGVADARWMVFGFRVVEREKPPQALTALAPCDAFRVLDNWHTSGMRGTGSADYEVEDLFVPAEMTFRMFIDEPRHPAPVFRLPGAFFSAAVATVALGIARGAAQGLIALADAKRPLPGRTALRDQAYAQYAVAKALALTESASAYLRQSIAEIWQQILADEEVGLGSRARGRRASVHAAEAAAEAVDLCCRAAGGNALRQSEPFERALRDVRAVLAHVVLQRSALEDVGRTDFGLPPLWPTF